MNAKIRLACAALAACAVSSPAVAAEGPWAVGDTFVVRSSKLDLDTASGRARLLKAVERAVSRSCEGEHTRGAQRRCEAAVRTQMHASLTARVRGALDLAAAERGTRLAVN